MRASFPRSDMVYLYRFTRTLELSFVVDPPIVPQTRCGLARRALRRKTYAPIELLESLVRAVRIPAVVGLQMQDDLLAIFVGLLKPCQKLLLVASIKRGIDHEIGREPAILCNLVKNMLQFFRAG